MYNSARKGTEAHWAFQEAITAHQNLESAVGDAEETFENLCGQIETFEEEAKELEEERDQIQRDFDELNEKYLELHGATDLGELITLLTNIKLAGEAINKYVTDKLVTLGALNEVPDPDSSDGDSGDGGGQVTAAEGVTRAATDGITRPQIP